MYSLYYVVQIFCRAEMRIRFASKFCSNQLVNEQCCNVWFVIWILCLLCNCCVFWNMNTVVYFYFPIYKPGLDIELVAIPYDIHGFFFFRWRHFVRDLTFSFPLSDADISWWAVSNRSFALVNVKYPRKNPVWSTAIGSSSLLQNFCVYIPVIWVLQLPCVCMKIDVSIIVMFLIIQNV